MCFWGEPCELYSTVIRKARKRHPCESCHRFVEIGEEYLYNSGRYEGSFFAYCVCNLCVQDSYTIFSHEIAEGCDWDTAWCPPGEIREYMEDNGLPEANQIISLREARQKLDKWYNAHCNKKYQL